MSTTAAIATIIALDANNKAQDTKCSVVLSSFNPKTASVQEMKEYSVCVERVHPDQLSGNEVVFVKASIICAIIGMIVGAYLGYKDFKDVGGGIILGIVGCIIGSVIPLALVLAVVAINFLFS